jgi:hypothetical protein
MGFFIFVGFLAGIGEHLFTLGVSKYIYYCGKSYYKEKEYEARYNHF